VESATPIRGALDEKNEVYMKAVAMEEGNDEDELDPESAVPARPTLRMHALRSGLVMILVIVSQSLGVAKVSCQPIQILRSS
jgi:hypothetical protein